MQDGPVNLIILLLHMTYNGSWRTENYLFPFPQLQHVAQNLKCSGWLINIDWKNERVKGWNI